MLDIESVLSQLKEQAGKVTMSQDELVCELLKAQEENEGLKNDIKELAYDYEELREVNAQLRDERRDLSFENANLKGNIENLQQDNFELQEALEATEQALDDALRQVAGFKTSDAYFKSRIEEAERWKKAYEELKNDTIDYEYLSKSYDSLRAEVEQLKQDNEVMMIGYCDYRDAYSKKCEENKQLKKDNGDIGMALTRANIQNAALKEENVLLKNHVANIASQIEELEKEVHSITKRKHSA